MAKVDLPTSQFKSLLDDLSSYPPWIKEAIYVHLAEDLKNFTDSTRLKNMTAKDCLFLFIPRLTRIGQTYLENLKYEQGPVDKKVINFIKSVKNQNNMIDIAQDNGWTLKVCCYYVIKCWEKNIILPTYSKHIYALVRLLSGNIDLGDYLVRFGRITREQLNWVVSMNKSGMMAFEDSEQSEYEDIFVNLGYITTDELNSLKQLMKFATSKTVIENPTSVLITKVRELQQKLVKMEDTYHLLSEQKEELQKRVEVLMADVQLQKNESVQYSKEINLLKEELKKALKG